MGPRRRRTLSRVLLCLGEYAEKPYFVERAYINVYSVEELCYCLMRNAYLVDEEIMDENLPDWLERECGLKSLAGKLRQIKEDGGTPGDYAGMILDYVGYGSREEIEKAKEEMNKGTGLSLYEKRKARADHLAENKKLASALKVYEGLMEELPEEEKELRANILYNRGVVYARLFRFRDAAESFRQSYEQVEREDACISYLAACRMYMEESEYLNFTAVGGQGHKQALKVEKLMEEALDTFEGTQESRMLFTLKVCREEENSVSYEEEVRKIADGLKEQYRSMAAE